MQGSRTRRRWRLAIGGVIVVLLSVAVLGVVGVARTRHASETVARSTALADAYARANKAIAEEESLERKYRLDRGDEVRARHAMAGAALRLRHVHDEYGYAVLRVFAAVDNGDLIEAARINNNDVDRIFYQISAEIQAAADLHAGRANAAIEELRRVEALVFGSLLGAVGLGAVLLVGLGLLVVRYQNTMMAQADRHEHAARHDALTGLPNLHRLGVRLSIDDYGTGYSSMAYLRQLPVDELKIDRSFVVNLSGADDDDAVLVRSAVDLGHNLGMTVVAEGGARGAGRGVAPARL
ncbi:EAL domain-containing protein [Dactylosporangium cerinum]